MRLTVGGVGLGFKVEGPGFKAEWVGFRIVGDEQRTGRNNSRVNIRSTLNRSISRGGHQTG